MTTGQGNNLWEYQNIIKNIFIVFFFLAVIFGSTLGFWAIQHPVPGHRLPLSGMDLKLDQLLAGHFQKFWDPIAPAHLVGL